MHVRTAATGLCRATLALMTLALPALARRAHADAGGDLSLDAFHHAIDSRGYITANASEVLGAQEFSFGLVTSWGHGVLSFADGARRYAITDVISPTLQAAVGLHLGLDLELGLTLPFHIVSGDVDGQGLGDVGAHVKVRLVDAARHPFGVALLVSAYWADGHEASAWLGERGVTFAPWLLVDRRLGAKLRVGVNLGVKLRPEPRGFTDDGMTGKTITARSELPFAAALSYAIVAQKLDVVGEVFGSVPLGGENYFPLEVVGALKLYLANSSYLLLGGGAGLVPGEAGGANPDARAFIGILFEPKSGDRDGDGVRDNLDRCPDDPEDRDDFEDADGCPEPDNDRDTILDEDDACPDDPEDFDDFEDADGCPEQQVLDRDGDHIADASDGCPDQPEDVDGFEDADGCPDPDNDGDHILDVDDVCPNEPETTNGFQDDDGCPDRTRAARTGGGIDIADKISFETNQAVIQPVSYPTLDAVAATMNANRDILELEIQGHTDERNTARYNLRLSQQRAEAVKRYLVEHGVAAGRLSPRGYGESRPIDKHHDAAAWSTNRRVQFVILRTE
jgi:OOP family OmpA-OmpF porin